MADHSLDPRNVIDSQRFPRLQTLQVNVSSTFIRRGAGPSSAAETEILFGSFFHVHKIGRGWVWGQVECQLPSISYPDYVGWCRQRDLCSDLKTPSHKISAISAPVFSKADIKSPVRFHLPLASTLRVQRESDMFWEMGDGFIHRAHVDGISRPSAFRDWVEVAECLIGRPYVWGGVSSEGLDCSGLVQTALRTFGQDALRDSNQQDKMGRAVKIADDLSGLKRGDLVFWKGHVGIMTSATQLLHANAWHMKVASEPLKIAVKRIAEKNGPVTTIRRLD